MRNSAAAGPVAVAQFQVSALPFVTGTASSEITSGTAISIKFPYVTQWFQVSCITNNASDVRVGFTRNGVLDGNHFTLTGGTSTAVLPIQCTELWFSAEKDSPKIHLIAGLTEIPSGSFLPLTGTGVG